MRLILVFLDAVPGPLRVEDHLPTLALLLGAGNGHEVGTGPALGGDLVRDALLGKLEVARGFLEGGVDDGVLYHHVGHGRSLPCFYASD